MVILVTKQQLPDRCKAYGEDVIFIYRPDEMPRTMKNGRKASII
jgi:hypothetical protein